MLLVVTTSGQPIYRQVRYWPIFGIFQISASADKFSCMFEAGLLLWRRNILLFWWLWERQRLSTQCSHSPSCSMSSLKVLYVGLIQNSKYWRGFFSPGLSSSDLTHMQVARLMTPNRNERTWRWMTWNTLCFPAIGNPGCRNKIGKLAVGGFHKPKQRPTFRPGTHIFKGE